MSKSAKTKAKRTTGKKASRAKRGAKAEAAPSPWIIEGDSKAMRVQYDGAANRGDLLTARLVRPRAVAEVCRVDGFPTKRYWDSACSPDEKSEGDTILKSALHELSDAYEASVKTAYLAEYKPILTVPPVTLPQRYLNKSLTSGGVAKRKVAAARMRVDDFLDVPSTRAGQRFKRFAEKVLSLPSDAVWNSGMLKWPEEPTFETWSINPRMDAEEIAAAETCRLRPLSAPTHDYTIYGRYQGLDRWKSLDRFILVLSNWRADLHTSESWTAIRKEFIKCWCFVSRRTEIILKADDSPLPEPRFFMPLLYVGDGGNDRAVERWYQMRNALFLWIARDVYPKIQRKLAVEWRRQCPNAPTVNPAELWKKDPNERTREEAADFLRLMVVERKDRSARAFHRSYVKPRQTVEGRRARPASPATLSLRTGGAQGTGGVEKYGDSEHNIVITVWKTKHQAIQCRITIDDETTIGNTPAETFYGLFKARKTGRPIELRDGQVRTLRYKLTHDHGADWLSKCIKTERGQGAFLELPEALAHVEIKEV